MAALTAVVAIATATPAHAAALGLGMSEKADAQPWMTNGIVYDQALSEDGRTLYIGGRFNSVRERPPGAGGATLAVNNVAAIDVATGAPVSTWRPAVTSNDGTAPVVRALAAKNGRVYIGGNFTTVGGQARRNLAAADAASGAVAPFSANVGTNTSTVHTLVADASRLYVGGVFGTVNGASRGNLAAVNATTGAVDAGWKARTNSRVRNLAFHPSGATVFAAGAFDSVSGPDGVSAPRQSVARFETATGKVHPWAIPTGTVDTPQTGWNLLATPTRLYAAIGRGPNYVSAFRLDNANSGSQVWRLGLVGNPQALAFSPDGGSRLVVGGHFGINPLDQQVCGGRYLKGLVALDPAAAERVGANGAIDCSWIPTLDQKTRPSYDGAWDLTTVGNRLWVGGGFVGVSGEPRTNLARFTYDPDRDSVRDTAEPTVTRPRPSPGAEIRDRTPTVRATVRDETDELGSPDIDLYVDGAPKAFAYDPDTDRLSRTTGQLSYGRHRVRVVAEDVAGNVAERSWSFRVLRKR